MGRRSLVGALLSGRCPRCREGKMFTYPWTRVTRFAVMNQACPRCGKRLEPEPGFYQGAMYVGYAFTVALIVVVSAILYFLGNPSEWVYIGTVIGVSILIAPLNYRYSRIIYLYAFGGIRYDPRHSE